jgi:hypothetical protein
VKHRQWRWDTAALFVLTLVWAAFFWHLFTPVRSDQASLKQGDFSGQFVAFASYQFDRMSQGEVPLWNPYNNGGLPFLADTQSAVFYPPRLLTLAIAANTGGFTYHTLELEMTAHVLFLSFCMYAFVRRLTLGRTGTVVAGLTAALVASYSGFISGYPPLQLALLEACVWFPLMALAQLEACRGEKIRWHWLIAAGTALGLSWMAGHPQSSYFLSLFGAGWFAFLVYTRRWRWNTLILGLAAFAGIALGLAAVQLIPAAEYLPLTARADLTFSDKGNGFPWQDILQVLYPGIMSLFSPLYIGFMGLCLALIALWKREQTALFWGIMLLIALLWSLGENGPLYGILYNVLPGLRFFRGQERAALLVVMSASVLAGLGVCALAQPLMTSGIRTVRRLLSATLIGSIAFMAVVSALWFGDRETYDPLLASVAFGTAAIAATSAVIIWLTHRPRDVRWVLLIPIVSAAELFTVSSNAASTYDPVPPDQQISMSVPDWMAVAVSSAAPPFRTDGARGVLDNFGSLYQIQDIHGISPLFLSSARTLIQQPFPNPVAWELFAVGVVFSDWSELPIASTITSQGRDRYGDVNLHRLADPRPFAQFMTDVRPVATQADALSLTQSGTLGLRNTLILESLERIDARPAASIPAVVRDFVPERVTITGEAPTNGYVSIALVDYPGWVATLNGQPVLVQRAYGSLMAIGVPAGPFEITLSFEPMSYRIGAVISAVTWVFVIVFFFASAATGMRRHANR